jgi:hypothetical protein
LLAASGYWWDGSTWHRPSQIFDMAQEKYVDRPVPAALTISAADLLAAGGADPDRGIVSPIGDIDIEVSPYASGRRWRDDLALWTKLHDSGRHLAGCVAQLTAPELAADELLGVAEMAEVAGINASTLRAYLTRGEAEVPLPQATVGGRSMWSRPVAQDWAEQRRRSSDDIRASRGRHPPGENRRGPPHSGERVWSPLPGVPQLASHGPYLGTRGDELSGVGVRLAVQNRRTANGR